MTSDKVIMPKVYPLTQVNCVSSIEIEKDFSNNNGNEIRSSEREIEFEKLLHLQKSEERFQVFQNILRDESPKYGFEFQTLIHGLLFILASAGSTIVYTFIPVHNIILFPEYWFELPLQIMFTLLPLWSMYIIFRCSYYMNIHFIKTYSRFLLMWFVVGLTTSMVFVMSYVVWVYILVYQYPVPLIGYLVFIDMIISALVVIWYLFPKGWRKNKIFRKRLKIFTIATIYEQFCTIEYGIVTTVLIEIPADYQWIPALFLPLIREINIWIIAKLLSSVPDGDISCVRMTLGHSMFTGHSLFSACTVGSIATFHSTAIIIGSDFLINIGSCIKMAYFRKYKKDDPKGEEKVIEMLQELTISEMVEVMVPFCYLLCFISAYYGPNANLIGDVGNNYWQYSKVDDVQHTIQYICVFLAIDISSLVICGYILWVVCGINVFKAYGALQKEFGGGFWVALTVTLNGVS